MSHPKHQINSSKTLQSEKTITALKALEKALKEIHSTDFLIRTINKTSTASIFNTPGSTKLAQSNKALQSDKMLATRAFCR